MAKSPSRSALLARELLGRIARRELRPGDPIDLPALGRRHGVSRTVVREALADLGGKGLVVARPKVGTTIAPESQWNLLDPVLVAVAIAETGPDSMLHEATDLRRVIEPALAGAASRDAGRTQQAAILDAVRSLAGAVGAPDADAWARADAALHAAIADACGNRLLRSIDHALVPVRAQHRERLLAARPAGDALGPVLMRTLGTQTALGLAIVRRDAANAAALALALVGDAAAPSAAAPARAVDARPAVPTRPAVAVHPVPSFVPTPRPQPARDDWPETETMVRTADPFAPRRRARLELDDDPGGLVVPALVADPPSEPASRAGLH
ncbi:MAG: GntR family transcriptional regulator [Burkholderiaceae bacterium]|jgi:DNA-binding FadR family transcriptional regulator|nr:FadR family transcriptional regulator [Burkholderiales bacterium]MCZ8340506.1 GntR family transcriptional regulator [Burkholderiaceae bacterium]